MQLNGYKKNKQANSQINLKMNLILFWWYWKANVTGYYFSSNIFCVFFFTTDILFSGDEETN